MASYVGTDIVNDGLVLHLDAANSRSYPGSGSTWYDLSGKNRHATFQTSIGYNQSNNGCMDFSIGNYATIPHDAEISSQVFGSSTNFTLSAWVNIRQYINYACFLQKSFAGSYSNTTCGLWAEDPNELRFVIGSNTSSNPTGGSTAVTFNATPNTWYHMVGVGNGTNAILYINGQNVGSVLFSGVTQTRTENVAPIAIGTRSATLGGDGSILNPPQLDGLVSSLSVYNRGLSQQEVRQNFEAQRSRYGI